MQSQKVKGRATKIVHTKLTPTNNRSLTEIWYHHTCVVQFGNVEEDEIRLNTGGYKTFTTRLRMNQASNQWKLGYRIWQNKFEWYLSWRGNTYCFNLNVMVLDPATGLVVVKPGNNDFCKGLIQTPYPKGS